MDFRPDNNADSEGRDGTCDERLRKERGKVNV